MSAYCSTIFTLTMFLCIATISLTILYIMFLGTSLCDVSIFPQFCLSLFVSRWGVLSNLCDYLHGFWRCRCLQRMSLHWLDQLCCVYFLALNYFMKLREVKGFPKQGMMFQLFVHTYIHKHVCVPAAVVEKAYKFLLNNHSYYVLTQDNKD